MNIKIHPTNTKAEKEEFLNPFPSTKGEVNQPYYSFVIPNTNKEIIEEFATSLIVAGMRLKAFAMENNVTIKAQFHNSMCHIQVLDVILPILQRFDIPNFYIIDGDMVMLDNKGELEGFISQDFLFRD